MSKSRSRGLDLNVSNESKRSRFERQDRNDMEGSSSHLLMEGSSTVVDSVRDADFSIKVGNVSYRVHQHILTSSSEYFRGMLAHDTKERRDGFVEMKEIDSQTMELCIDFMYDRDIDVTMVTAKTLLPAAEFLRLTELSKRCVDVLEENLKSGNCITVLKLARAYNCYELAENALDIFKQKLEMENYEDFCKLDKEGIKQLINNLDMETAWDGVINWIKLDVENRSSDIVELVKMLNWKSFPSSCFLYSIWSEPLFKASKFSQNWFFKHLFYDSKDLKEQIKVENCFIIDKISSEFLISKEAEEVISNFMETNLNKISKNFDFKSLSKDKVLNLFRQAEIGLCDEISHWKAVITWMKHNHDKKKIFPKLLQCICFHHLPKDFIKSTVETELLFAEFPYLYKTVLNGMATQGDEKSYVAFLYPDRKVYAWNISDKTRRQLPDYPVVMDDAKMFSFRDKLCVLNIGDLFYLSRNGTKWIARAGTVDYLGEYATVVSSDDKIYIVDNDRMSCYDPDTDTWDESLPGCGLDGKYFAGCTSDFIFARNTAGKERYYQFENSTWGEILNREVSKNGASTSKSDKLYAVGLRDSFQNKNGAIASKSDKLYAVGLRDSFQNSYQKAKIFNNSLNEWSSIRDTPFSIDHPTHLFFADKRLILLSIKNFYIYDEISDSWNKFGTLPQYYSRCFGKAKMLNPVSVCSFKGNLESLPVLDDAE